MRRNFCNPSLDRVLFLELFKYLLHAIYKSWTKLISTAKLFLIETKLQENGFIIKNVIRKMDNMVKDTTSTF